MRTTTRTLLLCLCVLFTCGCASLPPGTTRSPRDPWERMNRGTYKFNHGIDRAVLRPVAKGYARVVPQFMQTGVHNFFTNLTYPKVMINDLLQGQLDAFGNDVGRFVANTTIGIGGLFDPATPMGLERNDRDFGQTFGKWGIKSGPYLVLPLFGPSDVRDSVGLGLEYFTDPRYFVRNSYVTWPLWALGLVRTRAELLSLDSTIDSAYDPYALVRNAYLQHRDFKVNGGQGTQEQDEQEQKLFEEAAQDTDTPAPPAKPQGSAPPPPPPEQPSPPPR
jgi:phospholipid-binding lipoprotein MlaA